MTKPSRIEMLEKWRQEKGKTRKENCHPLLSRKRSLSQIVASPSYRPTSNIKNLKKVVAKVDSRRKTIGIVNTTQFKSKKLKKTGKNTFYSEEHIKTKTNIENKKLTDNQWAKDPKRKSISIRENHVPLAEVTSNFTYSNHTSTESSLHDNVRRRTFVVAQTHDKENRAMKQKQAKRKTIHTFHQHKLTSPRSPVTGKKENNIPDLTKTPWRNESLSRRERLDLWLAVKGKTPYTQKKTAKTKTDHCITSNRRRTITKQDEKKHSCAEESTLKISSAGRYSNDELNKIMSDVMSDENKPVEESQTMLEDLLRTHHEIVRLSRYWICRARIAERQEDVQHVICLLEQAYAFEAKPEEMIRDEICRFLRTLDSEEERYDLRKQFAVTPGRKVHFALNKSPVDFKSSIIRFCIVESKAFKRRLNAQLKRKVMTPVRRSMRLQESDIPQYLKNDSRLIDSPTTVEKDIIDGEIGFLPNMLLNTPLNKGWLLDENSEDEVEENQMELSFCS